MSTAAPTPTPAPIPTDAIGLAVYLVKHPAAALVVAAGAFALATACQLGFHPLAPSHFAEEATACACPSPAVPSSTIVPVRFDVPGLTRSAAR